MSPNLSEYQSIPLKDVSKRSTQLSLIALFLSLGITLYYLSLGLYPSSLVAGGFSLCMGILLLLYSLRVIKNMQRYIVLCVNILLVVSAYIEGVKSGQYFYYFPLIVVIPVIVDYKRSSYREITSYFAVSIVSFSLNFYIGHYIKPIETIPEALTNRMYFANSCSAILLTICFSLAYIYYERKYLKALLNEKNSAIAARTKFLSTMGHELRTPLNGIIGAINILKEEKRLNEEDEYFQILKYCSHHMQQLVNDVLDFNKIEAGKLEIQPIEVNLKQLLQNSLLPFYNRIEEKKLQLKVEIDDELNIPVFIDDVRLIQIMNNLLSNAIKFTAAGYIKLSVHCLAKTADSLNAVFIVEDTGIGIKNEELGRIFESFTQIYHDSTRNQVGTGLGLTICAKLLELMDSRLTVKSEVNQGSTFSFELTLKCICTKEHAEQNVNKEPEDLSGVKVLVVEDNQINMMIAKKMLDGFNADTVPAYNGLEALDKIDGQDVYDIILMDLEMPVLDGYTAIYDIRRHSPAVPVIAFTASLIDHKMLSDLKKSGFTDCLLKPFQPHQLFAIIKKYVKPAVDTNA